MIIFKLSKEVEESSKVPLNDTQRAILQYFFALYCGQKTQKGDYFKTVIFMKFFKSRFKDTPAFQAIKNLENHTISIDDTLMVKDLLVANGYLKQQVLFMRDCGNYEEYLPDEIEEVYQEYLKSEQAHAKFEAGEISELQYEEQRGKVWCPHTGNEGFDPWKYVAFEYEFGKDLPLCEELIIPSQDDIGKALLELADEELMKKATEMARVARIEKLKA